MTHVEARCNLPNTTCQFEMQRIVYALPPIKMGTERAARADLQQVVGQRTKS
jgi:hypothetical protein